MGLFPYADNVFHTTAADKQVGQVMMEIAHTDIALVKLDDRYIFENETFESSVDGACPARLRAFKPPRDMQIGDPIYMNNLFSGYSEGICGPSSCIRIHF